MPKNKQTNNIDKSILLTSRIQFHLLILYLFVLLEWNLSVWLEADQFELESCSDVNSHFGIAMSYISNTPCLFLFSHCKAPILQRKVAVVMLNNILALLNSERQVVNNVCKDGVNPEHILLPDLIKLSQNSFEYISLQFQQLRDWKWNSAYCNMQFFLAKLHWFHSLSKGRQKIALNYLRGKRHWFA